MFDCARVLDVRAPALYYVTGPLCNLASDSGRGRAWARCGHSVHYVSPGARDSKGMSELPPIQMILLYTIGCVRVS